ncbi:BarA sensory histidine kinase (= VarS = GacS) [hydrothermal vent metagenome]|uniref:BarA sensory histidine kinase (= VarS = GacS) n=1 Tax=hydrothermal vent metagenome TaxID=652676 RepID=A0A1W1CFN0_9ZZZZ
MIALNYDKNIVLERVRLAQAQGDISETIKILQDITTADIVDLLFFDPDRKYLYDKIKKNKISLHHLEGDTTSILGKAYKTKAPYHSLYTLYDENYNIAIDNPYKESISAQIIMPIVQDDEFLGVVRFSRHKYTFENIVFKKLLSLNSSLADIFIVNSDKYVDEIKTKSLFKVEDKKVYSVLDGIELKLTALYNNANDPEIRKLIGKAEESMESIRHYMKPDIDMLSSDKIDSDSADEKLTSIRVLIADDIEINVKILQAMIGAEDTFDITSAADGIEALEKIQESDKDGKYIHILFLDHHMPGKLGLEVAKIIRDSEKRLKKQKIIIVSITNDPEAIEANRDIYDYHIPKPFIKSDVIEVISKAKEDLS